MEHFPFESWAEAAVAVPSKLAAPPAAFAGAAYSTARDAPPVGTNTGAGEVRALTGAAIPLQLPPLFAIRLLLFGEWRPP